MNIYRITLALYAATPLKCSGSPARWNRAGEFVLYTASNMALACLENVVHRSGKDMLHPYVCNTYEIMDPDDIVDVDIAALPSDWNLRSRYRDCQAVGSDWYQGLGNVILRVPSSIIREEANYLFNTEHPDFGSLVRFVKQDAFLFDERLQEILQFARP
jgi:RES domain-containing protein